MSSLRTLARPYARAAFDLARGAGALAPWHEALQSAALLVADPASREWLDNPRLSVEQQAALFLPPGEQLDSAFGRFLLLMSENGRLSLLSEISDLFAELRAEAER
ncbi:MAG: F0F1 ATP synthase subunit delta, partial [Xanthomonadales bacterium]|nr:F0F1 ATP synthase subunit delta [Xanthomonadales bacterium]